MGVNNGSRVAAGRPRVGGGLYRAPLGTPLPTDSTTPLAAAYVPLGPISEDGIQPSRDTSTEKVKEWDGSTLAKLLSDESRTFEALLYGVLDPDVLEFVFGEANVTITPATSTSGTKIAVVDKGGQLDDCVLVFEMVHKGVKQRKILPVCSATCTGEENYVPGGLRGYTLEFEATKDASGAFTYEFDELSDKAA